MNKFTFQKLNINRKFFYTYAIILTIILLIFTFALYCVLYFQDRQRSHSSYQELLSNIEMQTDTSITDMKQNIFAIAINEQFRLITGSGEEQVAHYTYSDNTLLDIFMTLDAPLLNYHRIIAFNEYAYYNYSKVTELPSLIEDTIENYPWADQLSEISPKDIVLPPHPDPFGKNQEIVYSITRQIPSFIDNSITTVEIQNKYKVLESLYSIDENVGNIVVLTPHGEIVYPYGNEDIDVDYYLNLYHKDKDHKSSYFSNSYIGFSKSELTGWITFFVSNPKSNLSIGYTLFVYCIFIFIIIFLFILYIVQISTNRLLQPLTNLNDSIKQVSLDNLSLSIPNAESLDEFEFINHSFLDMFDQLENSFAQTLQSKANEERAYYLALEAQMNPHTIYNTISMIESVSYLNGDVEVSELCICFSEMLRYISDYTQTDYYLMDEIAHLKNYTQLIVKRYSGALTINIHVPDDISNFQLPKFTLQPLVENCIHHGMPANSNKFEVDISVIETTDGYSILIRDNGIGFSEQKLAELSDEFKNYKARSIPDVDIINTKIGNLALKNIYYRLHVMYGENATFTLANNSTNSGGLVTITIKLEETTHA